MKFKDKKATITGKDSLMSLNKNFDTIKKKTKVKKKYLKNVDKIKEDEVNVPLKTEEDGYQYSFNGSVMPEVQHENIQDAFSILWVKYKPRSTPYVRAGSDWTLENLPEPEDYKFVPLVTRKRLRDLAERMYRDDLQAHKALQEKRRGHSSKPFHKLILAHGTTRDKIAELTLQCMESPLYSLDNLFSLLDFIDIKFKNNLSEAIDNIINIFQTTFLPNDYVVREFESHNFSMLVPLLKSNMEQVEKQLILWYFESQIQIGYIQLISNLEKLCRDLRVSIKTWGINALSRLLKMHPDQEVDLIIRTLVNKLGDLNKKVAGNVLYVLNNMQMKHPRHSITIVSLIEELLYRPNVSSRAQYFCLCCLKDIIIKRSDQSLAERLVKLYFDFFRICSESGEVDSRFMSALLRGLNRAYPHLEGKRLPFIEDQVATLYKLCHMVNFTIGTQALQLIYQVQNSTENEMSDRFYSLLYRKLFEPSFTNSSTSGAFLNIIFKSMIRDTDLNRVRAFFRRLVQVSLRHSPSIAVSVLYMISEAMKDNPTIESMAPLLASEKAKSKSHFNDDDNDDFEYYPDLDVSDEVDTRQDPMTPLTSSDSTADSTINTQLSSSSASGGNSFQRSSKQHSSMKDVKIKSKSSWLHRENWKPFQNRHDLRTNVYDPLARNPSFAGANLSPIWELRVLGCHFHPTVSLFVSQLMNETLIEYSGDPLEDFTSTRFLDRFLHKNPKKIDPEKAKAGAVFGSRSSYIPRGTRNIPIESERFKALKQSKIAVEDIVFHNYYTQYQKVSEVKKEEKIEAEDSDDEFDQYLSSLNRNHPNVTEDDEEDDAEDDLDFARNAIAANLVEHEDDVDEDIEEEESDIGESDEDMAEFEEKIDQAADEEDDDISGVSSGDDADDIADGAFDVGKEEDDDDSFPEDDDLDDEDDWLEDDVVAHKKLAKKSKFSPSDWRSMLVDADEFSQLLESNASNDRLAGTSEAMSNKDNSGVKQLMWEKKQRQKPFQRKSSSGGNSWRPNAKPNFKRKTNKPLIRKKK